jgi:integrase
MGRKRKDDSLQLPSRVYVRAGTFYYVHADTGRWENLGKDLGAARKRADHYNDPTGTYGTMTWFLDQFVIDCEQRSTAGTLSKRTVADYRDALPKLKAYFGAMLPTEVGPEHVSDYLELGAKLGRAVRANRERACLSSCMSWMLRTGQAHGGLKVNPCMRASGVQRNEEAARERYVTHEEYLAVHAVAPAQVRLFMELIYRTLQRPESDMIRWTAAIVRRKADGRVLHFRQEKTGRLIDIALTGRIEDLIDTAIGAVPVLHQPIVHTLAGEVYTYTGLSSMLKRAQAKVRMTVPALKNMPPFGFRDLKGKGATDMWLEGTPIERIQLLCGHASKATTEKYIKARWRETAAPNSLAIA